MTRGGAIGGLLILMWTGCIDPIDLDVGPAENRLVVEAQVREGPGPHYVDLSRSGAFTEGLEALRPRERGAVVAVETGSGKEVAFTEVSAGRYEPPEGSLSGEVGETYTLWLRLADGTEYRSRPEVMLSAPEIADFYAELEEYVGLVNGVEVPRHRLVLFADAERTPDRTDYYRWTWSGTYATFTCVGDECQTCYRQVGGGFLELGDDVGAVGPVVPRNRTAVFPLQDRLAGPSGGFTPPMIGWAFMMGFQITLEQQALDTDAHHFWTQVVRQRDDVGGLFDPPAERIFGNVARVDDPTDTALGYFTVAGTSHQSACFDRSQFQPEWPSLPNPFSFREVTCGTTISGSTTPPPEWVKHCTGESIRRP